MNAEQLLEHYDKVADAPDAVARLRKFVLDLAVRGKLVEQDPSDEPVDGLLKRVAEEKARLQKSGAIREIKLLPTIATPPFDIPEHWRWSQFAEVGLLSPRNDAPDGISASFVPMTRIPAEYGAQHTHEVRPWADIKKGFTHFAKGDVGLAKITPCFENGKSAVFENLTGGFGSGTTELHVVRPLFVNASYMLIFLKSPHYIESGIPRMTGTAGQKRVPSDYFAHSAFPLPPIGEQERIVAKVDELMLLCYRLEISRAEREAARDRLAAASLARLNAPDPETFRSDARFALSVLPDLTARADQIKQLRQTILNLAVRGKLVAQDPKEETASKLIELIDVEINHAGMTDLDPKTVPFSLPSGWAWIPFSRIVANSDAGWSPKTADHAREAENWGVLKVSAVSWGEFRPQENKEVLRGTSPRLQAQVHAGDFLISRANTSELVARAVIVNEQPRNLMMSDKIVRLQLSTLIDARFMLIVNNYASYARGHYSRLATGVSPSMKNVSREVILSLPIPLPPLKEQRRIVVKVNELMLACTRLEASLTSAQVVQSRAVSNILNFAMQASEAGTLN